MRIVVTLVCLLGSIVSFNISAAQSELVPTEFFQNIDEAKRQEQRTLFKRLESTVWKMNNNELREAVIALDDYPLVPYLIERKLSDKMRLSDEQQVSAFLSLYAQSPLASKVRRNWLKYLAKRQRAALFIQYYRPSRDPKLACAFIDFQIKQGIAPERVYQDIAKLWTVGKSQPKACDGIFKRWKEAGQLSEDLVLLRIKKAADGGSHTLIPYLRKLLPSNKQYLADLWHKTRRDPAIIRKSSLFPGKYPLVEAEIMSYGLSRLIWRDTALALKTMQKAEQRITFTQTQKARIYGRFAIKLAIDNHTDAEDYLIKAAEVGDDVEVTRWHLAYLLRQQDWASIVLLIENSSAQKVAANDYSYWLARAYEQLGRQDEANALYTQLAQNRHYYGFLASARINQPYQLQHQSVEVSKDAIASIMALDSTQRAYELRQFKRYHEARLEWRTTQRQLSDEDQLATTVISSAWDWHDQSIFTFSREGYLNDVERRFPTAYESLITKEAQRNRIEPEWAFAIARRESSFMSDAVSSANARGLMQVLPSTAKYLEKRRVTQRQLLDAKTNVKIGNKYLRYLLDKLDNNSILATASYNAGWRRVKQWLPENEALEADIWVELIPFKETRNYVKAVMAYKQIYQGQLAHDNIMVAKPAKVFADFIETDIPVSL
ncbi:MAG: transglycosylase SLT domain-containing protein [Glaciecola sp.]